MVCIALGVVDAPNCLVLGSVYIHRMHNISVPMTNQAFSVAPRP